MRKLLQEFQQFIQRGSVVDLAVGVIMGAAFGKIVNSLVADVLMPPIGWLIGGVDFKELKFSLPEVSIQVPNPEQVGELMTRTLPAVDVKYGLFLQTLFDFLIVAACVFVVVKGMNTLYKKQEQAPAPPPPQEVLLGEIRDLLKKMAD
uniref:Large-conductance mechanosensitive channel n=1 Tax=Schlesneria paludicola TaxID=360056 RepID=A0A7C2K3B5_9PLAN